MGQSEEYLAAHAILVKNEERIAALQAQVEELQGDVSRLTIENEQLKEQLRVVPLPSDENFPHDYTHIAEPIDKPTKKPRTSK